MIRRMVSVVLAAAITWLIIGRIAATKTPVVTVLVDTDNPEPQECENKLASSEGSPQANEFDDQAVVEGKAGVVDASAASAESPAREVVIGDDVRPALPEWLRSGIVEIGRETAVGIDAIWERDQKTPNPDQARLAQFFGGSGRAFIRVRPGPLEDELCSLLNADEAAKGSLILRISVNNAGFVDFIRPKLICDEDGHAIIIDSPG